MALNRGTAAAAQVRLDAWLAQQGAEASLDGDSSSSISSGMY
jgi:hypothetical protein